MRMLQNTPGQFDCIFVQGLMKGNTFIQPLQEGKNPFCSVNLSVPDGKRHSNEAGDSTAGT